MVKLALIMAEDKVKKRRFKTGLVQIFAGDGRGKTSAALGTAIRAAGYGLRVFIVFFMKARQALGEYKILTDLPNVDWEAYGRPSFLKLSEAGPEDRELGRKALKVAEEAVMSGRYDLVVLDEVNNAATFNIVDIEAVKKLIKEKPPEVELILTGRFGSPELYQLADMITELKSVKHPFDKGIPARKGIDF